MSNLEKLYYNLYNLTDDCADTQETEEAYFALKESLGEELYGECEEEILSYATANEKQGFIYGFQYAVSLLTNGKAVGV